MLVTALAMVLMSAACSGGSGTDASGGEEGSVLGVRTT